jgi:hypothetical protein
MLLALAACSTPSVFPDTQVAPPFSLEVSAAIEGEQMTFTLLGGPPGGTAFLGASGRAGSGPCPPLLNGACLGLVNPTLLGTRQIGPNGRAQWTATVPDPAPAAEFHFQAAFVGGQNPAVTGVVTRVVGDEDLDGVVDGLGDTADTDADTDMPGDTDVDTDMPGDTDVDTDGDTDVGFLCDDDSYEPNSYSFYTSDDPMFLTVSEGSPVSVTAGVGDDDSSDVYALTVPGNCTATATTSTALTLYAGSTIRDGIDASTDGLTTTWTNTSDYDAEVTVHVESNEACAYYALDVVLSCGGDLAGDTATATPLGTPTGALYLFDAGSGVGSFGGRDGADAYVRANAPAGLLTTLGSEWSATSLFSLPGDALADFPTNHGIPDDQPVYMVESDGTYTQVAADWADFVDGTIDASLDAMVSGNSTFYWWSGSNNDGTASDADCSGFSSVVGQASIGAMDDTVDFLSTGNSAGCSASAYRLLGVAYEVAFFQ